MEMSDIECDSDKGAVHNYVIPAKAGASAGGMPIQRGCEMCNFALCPLCPGGHFPRERDHCKTRVKRVYVILNRARPMSF